MKRLDYDYVPPSERRLRRAQERVDAAILVGGKCCIKCASKQELIDVVDTLAAMGWPRKVSARVVKDNGDAGPVFGFRGRKLTANPPAE